MSRVDPAALAEWQSAVGRSEIRDERLECESLRRYALAVGADPEIEMAQPALPHWAFFLPRPGDADIGGDGHSRRGGFLPAVNLPSRMFAASDILFEMPLVLGAPARSISTIAKVAHKIGRSGDLVFVDVDRVITQDGRVRVRERQCLVYREAGEPASPPVAGSAAPEGEIWQPGPVNLFRFSAVTFNSHRIHYDLPYAQREEGYPALVVHAPFTAAKLAALAARHAPLTRFSFRAQAPLYLGAPIVLQAAEGEVRAVRCDGVTAMTAKVQH